jgi:hypothetical protein
MLIANLECGDSSPLSFLFNLAENQPHSPMIAGRKRQKQQK